MMLPVLHQCISFEGYLDKHWKLFMFMLELPPRTYCHWCDDRQKAIWPAKPQKMVNGKMNSFTYGLYIHAVSEKMHNFQGYFSTTLRPKWLSRSSWNFQEKIQDFFAQNRGHLASCDTGLAHLFVLSCEGKQRKRCKRCPEQARCDQHANFQIKGQGWHWQCTVQLGWAAGGPAHFSSLSRLV